MNDKKKFLLITIIIVTLGLLALILSLTSFSNDQLTNRDNDSKFALTDSNDAAKLNRIVLINEGSGSSGYSSGITYEREESAGYTIATSFTFTRNIDVKKAVEALKPYMIFYNGNPVHTDSNIVCNINGDWADVSVTFPDGTCENSSTGIQVIDSTDGVEFAAVSPFGYFRYACVIDKSTCPSGYDVNKVPLKANKSRYTNLQDPVFTLNYNDSLQEENDIWSETTIKTGNGKYHHAFANVRILNDLCVAGFVGTSNNNDTYQGNENTNQQMEQQFPEEEAPDINNPENPNYNDNPEANQNVEEADKSFVDSVKQSFEKLKTNIQNNETYQIAAIAISSVVGIALLYIIYIIIRKLWHVIRK